MLENLNLQNGQYVVEPDFQNTVPDLYERAQENGSMEM